MSIAGRKLKPGELVVELPEIGAIIEELKGLRDPVSLKIKAIHLEKSEFEALQGFPTIYHVAFDDCGITDETLADARFPATYWIVSLRGNPITRIPAGCRTDLYGLDLQDTLIGDDECLRVLERYRKLHELNLRGTKVTEKVIPAIKGLGELVDLWTPNEVISDDAITPSLNLPSSLDLQNLPGMKITDLGVRKIVELKKSKDFDTLDLTNTNVTDIGLLQLAELPSLRCIFLEGTKVTGEGLRNYCEKAKTSYSIDRPVFLTVDKTLAIPDCAEYIRIGCRTPK